MAKPSINEIMTNHDGTTFVWLRPPWNPAGYYYLSGEDENLLPSTSRWSKRYDTFEGAEVDAAAERARAEERAKKKK